MHLNHFPGVRQLATKVMQAPLQLLQCHKETVASWECNLALERVYDAALH